MDEQERRCKSRFSFSCAIMSTSALLKAAMEELAASGEAPPLGFEPSKLGTIEHWESVYKREVAMHKEIGDEGEVWFGEDAAEAMKDWAEEYCPPNDDLNILDSASFTPSLPHLTASRADTIILTIVGSGNGQLLFVMHEANYANLTGIDYSPSSIQLSNAIAEQRSISDVTFIVCDVLTQELPTKEAERWGLILDKGTYDAISLSDEIIDGSTLRELYPARIARLLKPGGIFLITSCQFFTFGFGS